MESCTPTLMQISLVLAIISLFAAISTVAQAPSPSGLRVAVIHGDVLCQNCTASKPAQGSTVELRCNRTTIGDSTAQEATVTSQGFFVMQVQNANEFQANLCRIFMKSPPPNETCKEIADQSIASYGAPLNRESVSMPSWYAQYNVSTLIWRQPESEVCN